MAGRFKATIDSARQIEIGPDPVPVRPEPRPDVKPVGRPRSFRSQENAGKYTVWLIDSEHLAMKMIAEHGGTDVSAVFRELMDAWLRERVACEDDELPGAAFLERTGQMLRAG